MKIGLTPQLVPEKGCGSADDLRLVEWRTRGESAEMGSGATMRQRYPNRDFSELQSFTVAHPLNHLCFTFSAPSF